MANPDRGEVELLVKEKPYVLRLSNGGLRSLQKRTGKTFGAICRALDDADIEVITLFIFESLQAHHAREFSQLVAVDRLVDEAGGYLGVLPSCLEVIRLNLPKPKAGDSDPQNAQATSTGDGSGSTPADAA